MRFPNAYKGVKKLFTAEILGIVSTVLLVIVAAIALAGGSGDIAEGESAAIGTVAGVIGIIALILGIIYVVINLVGLSQCSKDEKAFKTAFIFAIIQLIVTCFSGALDDKMSFIDLLVKLCTIIVFIYTIQGISNLAKKYGNENMVSLGNKIIILQLILIIVSAILDILPKGTTGNIATTVSSVLDVVIFVVYLVYLSRAKKMLEN